ncbi:MAG: hypothetical protein P8J32_08625, partial [bacterium]|nr:hypothetical protein [bacterium]
SSITTVFLLRSGERMHKQLDRNPRYDGRDLVWQLHSAFQANLFLLDVTPRPVDLQRFHETELLTWGSAPRHRVLDVHHEQMSSVHGVISYSAHVAIGEALGRGEQVICVYNKKGSARQLRCKPCGRRFSCPNCQTALTSFTHTLECSLCRHKEPLPMRCPSCQSSEILKFGHGNQRVAEELAAQFPAQRVAIIDKDHEPDLHADILVVTQYYLENLHDPFKKVPVGLVVQLDADGPLYSADPRAIEDLSRQLWQWAWVANGHRVPYLIQTASLDLVERAMQRPFVVANDELTSRVQYQLPPVYRWCRVTLKESEKRKAEIAVNQLREQIKQLDEASLHGLEWNRDGHAQFDVGIPFVSYPVLRDLFTGLDDQYIIDTNVFS